MGAEEILEEQLASGDQAAWETLFRWLSAPVPPLRAWNLLHAGSLPADTSDAFWGGFLQAWEQGRLLHADQPGRDSELVFANRRADHELLWNRLLSRPPTPITRRAVEGLLSKMPRACRHDARLSAFGFDVLPPVLRSGIEASESEAAPAPTPAAEVTQATGLPGVQVGPADPLAELRDADEGELVRVVVRLFAVERLRGPAIEHLVGRLRDGGDAPIRALDAVLRTRSVWEKFGPEIVEVLVDSGRSRTIWLLAANALVALRGKQERMESVCRSIQFAMAAGLIRWATNRLSKQDHRSVHRALTAICLLDPPRPITPCLVAFGKLHGLDETAMEWIGQLRASAVEEEHRTADLNGIFEAVRELEGASE